MQTSDSFVS